MFLVSLPEAESLIGTLNKAYGIDLSGRSMASFRLRLSEIILDQKLENAGALGSNLLENKNLLDSFLRDLSIGSPDMFRDPDLWKYIRDQLLPLIHESELYPEIIVPECITGYELFTMKLVLSEVKIDYRVDITAICNTLLLQEQVKRASLSQISYKNSRDNYDVFNPGGSLEKYTELQNGKRYLIKDTHTGIKYRIQGPELPYCSDKTRLILYRNRMIYQTSEFQRRILRKMFSDMREGTYLVTGIRESIDSQGLDHLYETVDPDLKIYRRNNVN